MKNVLKLQQIFRKKLENIFVIVLCTSIGPLFYEDNNNKYAFAYSISSNCCPDKVFLYFYSNF